VVQNLIPAVETILTLAIDKEKNMSYRNPQQIIDTQSGQHIRNMMKTVTDTAVNVIKTRQKELEETKRKNVAMQTQIIQAQGKLANSANAEDIKNSGTDWATAIRSGVKRYGELYAKSIKDPLNFSSNDSQEMAALANMGTQIKQQAIEDQADMEEWTSMIASGAGNYGGFDKYGNPKIYKRLNIQGRVGATPGRSVGTFNWDSETGGLTTKVASYDAEGKEVGTNANRGAELPIIANPTKNMQEIANAITIAKKDYYKGQSSTPEYDPVTKKTEYYREANMDQLIADVRSQSDGYIVGLGAQAAIRLSNNTMIDEMDDPAKGQGFIKGDLAKIIDPDKVVWQMNENGKVNDPQLERIQIAYAKKIIKDRGLAPSRKVDSVRDKKRAVIQNKESSFKSAINNFAPEIDAGSKGIWELKGEGDDRYYFLPAPVDKDGIQKAGTKDRTIKYYIYPKGIKTVNEINLRAGMLKVKD